MSQTGNPTAYDVMADAGATASEDVATSKALHPPGQPTVTRAAAPGAPKIEDVVRQGLADEDPADRPHGSPDTWTP